jgi:Secretion system C-terminal sorting domain
MKTFLLSLKSITGPVVVMVFSLFSTNILFAQSGNLLSNPGFEAPLQLNINANNIIGIGISFGGWSCTNGGFNIIRVNGAGYSYGPDNAAEGVQYVDVASTDGYISRTFTISAAGILTFKGSFSTREMGSSSYVNWTASISILNSSNTVVATSATMNFTPSTPKNSWYLLSGTSGVLPAGTYTYRAYTGNWGHFDNASVTTTAASSLPVKLESFTAVARDKNAILNWVASQEINVSHYVVEKSYDGRNFSNAGIVFAAGNTTENTNYTFPDNNITSASGMIWYRLRSVDNDGKSELSETRLIRVTKQDGQSIGVIVYPNPVSNELRITIPNSWQGKKISYQVVGVNGQAPINSEAAKSSQTETINVSKLPPGFYIVKVTCDNQIAQQKIIKQ